MSELPDLAHVRLSGIALAKNLEEVGLAADQESVEAVRAAADAETYKVAYAEGHALSVDEAVQLAFADASWVVPDS